MAVLLTGCAELQVYPLAESDTAPKTGALPYSLPRTVIDLAVSLTLKSCVTKRDEKGAPYLSAEINGAFTPTTSVEADPTASYYLSYNSSRGFLKEINYTVGTYSNGALQTFNATVNDQAGAITIAAVATGIQIASAGAVPRVSDVGGGGQPLVAAAAAEFCSADVITAFQAIDVQNKAIKAEKDRADAAQKAALGDPARPGPPLPSVVQTAEILSETTAAIAAAQARIAELQKGAKLTRTATYHWAPSVTDREGANPTFLKSVNLSPLMDQWLSDAGKAWSKAPHTSTTDAPMVATTVTMAIAATASTIGSDIVAAKAPPTDPAEKAIDGLVVRTAARGQLRVYQKAPPPETNGLIETTDVATPAVAIALPQFGRRLVLPVHNTLFQNDVLQVSVNADGSISSIGFHASSTAATGLAAVGTAAGTYGSWVAARNTAVAAENTANAAKATYPDTVNKALADCYTSAATILKANGTPVPCQP